MLTEERRRTISNLVRDHGAVSAGELAEQFAVSHMTIYRDLVVLEDQCHLRRVRGGAVSLNDEPQFGSKQEQNRDNKALIARYAAERFLAPGDIVILEAGTTVAALVRALPKTLSTIMTNGLETLNEAKALLPEVSVMSCGGMLRAPSHSFVGPEAEEFFKHVQAQTFFLSATALALPEGITDPNPLEIQVKRAMARSAQRTVLLLDSSKFGQRSLRTVLPLGSVHALVTDAEAPRAQLEELRALTEVHIVEG